MKFHRFRTPLFSVYSLSRPAPTAVRQPFTSNSDFHFPIPRVIMNHGLGFQDCTRLHLPKSKSDFPYSSLLGSDPRLKPSSLSLINWSFLCVLRYLCSLVISKSTKPFTLLYIKIFPVSLLHRVASCCCHRLTPHQTPPPHFVSTLHHGSSQPLRLGFLVSDQVKFLPFSSLFFCILCL